ncbi:MAG: ABC transporter ATP-binding protein [Clostridia bacterium]|nr:ABC transporter ATP-binding protein [Clostridia bacterium]
MIRVRGLKKRYGGRVVLDIAALDIGAGERVALLGPNGSGKSTLLKLLAGVLRPDEGELSVAAEACYLPQTPYAFDCSVRRNVLLALHGLPRAEAEAEAMRALSLVGLETLAEARGNRLSGGETQRMALARVLARPHALLLLDEPTSAADLAAGGAIEAALADYLDARGAALLFSTHAPAQARRLAERVLLLHEGRVAEDGAPEAVLNAPETPEAAAFLKHWRF